VPQCAFRSGGRSLGPVLRACRFPRGSTLCQSGWGRDPVESGRLPTIPVQKSEKRRFDFGRGRPVCCYLYEYDEAGRERRGACATVRAPPRPMAAYRPGEKSKCPSRRCFPACQPLAVIGLIDKPAWGAIPAGEARCRMSRPVPSLSAPREEGAQPPPVAGVGFRREISAPTVQGLGIPNRC